MPFSLSKIIKTRYFEKAAFYSMMILIMNVALWFANVYPKHIIEIDDGFSFGATLIQLLCFCIYFYILAVGFSNRKKEPKPLYWTKEIIVERFHLDTVLLLLGARVLLDGLYYLGAFLFKDAAPFYSDLLTVLGWFGCYWILQRKEQRGIFQNKKSLLILSGILLTLLGLCIAFDLKDLNTFRFWSEKLVPESENYLQIKYNLAHAYGVRNLLLDSASGILFFFFHMYSQRVEKNYKVRLSNLIYTLPLRLSFITSIAIVIVAFKTLIVPENTLILIPQFDSGALSFDGARNKFIFNDYEMTALRMGETLKAKTCSYKRDTVVQYGKRSGDYKQRKRMATISSFLVRGKISGEGVFEVKREGIGWYDEYEINDQPLTVYRDMVVCYAENDKPTVIRFDEIVDQPQNDTLIQACQTMLADGNMVAFDYAGAYLKKYSTEFLNDYLLRYSKGEFTEQEQKYISVYNYREDYLMGVAKELLNGFEVAID